MNTFFFFGLLAFTLLLLFYTYQLKKKTTALELTVDEANSIVKKTGLNGFFELSTLYNKTEDLVGLIKFNNDQKLVITSLNQASITLINEITDHPFQSINLNKTLPVFFKDVLKFTDEMITNQLSEFEKVIKSSERVSFETSFRLKNHITKYYDVTLTPVLHEETNKCKSIIFVCHDVTKRRKIKMDLIASEAHSKNLFEHSPIIIWDEDFSAVKNQFDELKASGVSDFRAYFDQHPEAVKNLSSLIKVKNVNQKSIDFYAMGNKEKHINDIPFYFIDESWEVLKEEFIALAEGATSFESEIPIKRLDGTIIYLIINLSVPPCHVTTWKSIIVSFIDVSKRKKTELLLAESKEEINAQLDRNKLIIENTLNGYLLADIEGNIVTTNASYTKLTGYSKEELTKMNINQIEVHISPEEIKHHIDKLIKNGSARFETTHRKKDGSFLIFDANLSFMQYENSPMIAAFLSNITTQKQTQKELEYRFNFESLLAKISTQFINLNIEKTDHGIQNALMQLCKFTNFDRGTIILFSNNKNACSIHYEWHIPSDEPILNSFQNVPISELPWLLTKIKKNESVIILNQEDIPSYANGLRKLCNDMNLSSIVQVPMTWQGEIIGFISFCSSKEKQKLPVNIEMLIRLAGEMISNVLQRKQTAEAIKETEKKSNEILISKILETEDRERKRMSKELHDSLGQNLTTASLNLKHLNDIIANQSEQNQQKFKNGLKFLNIAIDESRNIAHNLMPQTIIDFGYVATVENLAEDLSTSSNTDFVFYTNLQKRLPPDQELSLFRITQEAINNILKHAKASKVTIQLMKYNDAILLTIEDNGQGFNLEDSSKNSFGLNSIKNRVSALSGQIDIDSQPKKGTSITVKVEMPKVL